MMSNRRNKDEDRKKNIQQKQLMKEKLKKLREKEEAERENERNNQEGDNEMENLNPNKNKKVEMYFNFILFGKFGYIGSRQFLSFVSMHDFLYSAVFSQYYYLLFYLFTAGPMTLVGKLCMVGSLFSIIVCIVSGIFKFRLSRLIDSGAQRSSNIFFNFYFFTKMTYVICATILSFYLLFAFIIRASIEFIEWPERATPFTEGRREMSTRSALFTNLTINFIIILANSIHLLQNLYWLKLKSTSWVDLTVRHKEFDEDEDDDSFN